MHYDNNKITEKEATMIHWQEIQKLQARNRKDQGDVVTFQEISLEIGRAAKMFAISEAELKKKYDIQWI